MIFFRKDYSFQDSIQLSKSEIKHLQSLRIQKQSKSIDFRDGEGCSYIYQFQENTDIGQLIEKKFISKTSNPIIIATALPKGNRLDWMLQKGTEIGVSNFIFVQFQQSDRKELNIERSIRILMESAAQSKQYYLPQINLCNSLEEYLLNYQNSFYLEPTAKTEISSLEKINMIPMIGPEGGFRKVELELLSKKNVSGFRLKSGILRIETAFVYLASILNWMNCK